MRLRGPTSCKTSVCFKAFESTAQLSLAYITGRCVCELVSSQSVSRPRTGLDDDSQQKDHRFTGNRCPPLARTLHCTTHTPLCVRAAAANDWSVAESGERRLRLARQPIICLSVFGACHVVVNVNQRGVHSPPLDYDSRDQSEIGLVYGLFFL